MLKFSKIQHSLNQVLFFTFVVHEKIYSIMLFCCKLEENKNINTVCLYLLLFELSDQSLNQSKNTKVGVLIIPVLFLQVCYNKSIFERESKQYLCDQGGKNNSSLGLMVKKI